MNRDKNADIIKAVIAFLGSGTRFTCNTQKISEAFFELCTIDDLKELLSDFCFYCHRGFDFNNDDIDHELSVLQMAGLLDIVNLEIYQVTKRLAGCAPRLISKHNFSKDEIQVVRSASKEFSKLIGAQKPSDYL